MFLWLDERNLNAKERHFILPLVIWTFIMQFVAFISLPSQVRTTLFSLTIKNHTYLRAIFIAFCTDDNLLEDIIQSIGRYGGHSWQETGFKGFGCTSIIST